MKSLEYYIYSSEYDFLERHLQIEELVYGLLNGIVNESDSKMKDEIKLC